MGAAAIAHATVPVRVSIKFILDANGNRPTFGMLNTDAEIVAELREGNSILAAAGSEFRIDELELTDLPGVPFFYGLQATEASRNTLRAVALANPPLLRWRNDAINIYINGGTSSAISQFPPDNDIILMNQWCGNTPSCILHELGHSLQLRHTHEPDGDGCDDTIEDNEDWTKDQLSDNAFGGPYASLSSSQRAVVDLVFNNVMSYHIDEPQRALSGCQRDVASSQGDEDRAWLLSRLPIYVDGAYAGGTRNGRFLTPFVSLDAAIMSSLAGENSIVLESGNYRRSAPINTEVVIGTRSGKSTIHEAALLCSLETDLSGVSSQVVRRETERARQFDTQGRARETELQQAVLTAPSANEATRIRANAASRIRENVEAAKAALEAALSAATGVERIVIAFELAQRYRDTESWQRAAELFGLVASESRQKHLRIRAEGEERRCLARLGDR